jgi:hypothetical protein
MPTKTSSSERRSRVAESCIGFGRAILETRVSSASAQDAQEAVRDLFEWFKAHDAFTEGNVGIAVRAVEFGGQLLESRKTATVGDAIAAIQQIFEDLSE